MSLQDHRIGFVGAGNITESLMAGLLHGQHVLSDQLIASDIDPARRDLMARTYNVRVTDKNRETAGRSDIWVLAVEPQVLDEVLDEIATVVGDSTLVISVAAGYPMARIHRHLPRATMRRIVRAMPNTPSIIREGITALAFGDEWPADDAEVVRAMFQSIGKVVTVDERSMDAVTGLSGSGPAYIYVMVEALADGGVKMGLSRQTAQLLAAQTVAGAAQLVLASDQHTGILKDRVASPGGATIAGLHALEKGGFRASVISAVEAATRRSIELGMNEGGMSCSIG